MADPTSTPTAKAPPPGPPEAVGFTRKGAERIIRATQRVERAFRNPAPPQGRYPSFNGPIGRIALLTSNVTAGSGTGPGSGTANLLTFDGTNYITSDAAATVYNAMPSELVAGLTVILLYCEGWYFVVAVPCLE